MGRRARHVDEAARHARSQSGQARASEAATPSGSMDACAHRFRAVQHYHPVIGRRSQYMSEAQRASLALHSLPSNAGGPRYMQEWQTKVVAGQTA